MKRNRYISKALITEMTDPEIEFVSLVEHGANRTSFRETKHALKTLNICNNKIRGELSDMSVKTTKATADVKTFKFSKDKFVNPRLVAEYLTNKGYSDYKIIDSKNVFTVDFRPDEDFVGDMQEIDTKKGVVMTVGELKQKSENKQVDEKELDIKEEAKVEEVKEPVEAEKEAPEANEGGATDGNDKPTEDVGKEDIKIEEPVADKQEDAQLEITPEGELGKRKSSLNPRMLRNLKKLK